MTAARLSARRTAAAAVLADYTRQINDPHRGAITGYDWAVWAGRLASELQSLIAAIDDIPAGDFSVMVAEIRAIFQTFVWETGDRQAALERIEAIVHEGDGIPAGPAAGDVELLREATTEGACTLTTDDAATALAALTDAAEYHEYRASLTCADCAAHPAELCDEHGAALDAAAEYRALALQLQEAVTAETMLQSAFPEWRITQDGAIWQARLITTPPDAGPVLLIGCDLLELADSLNNYLAGGER